MLGDLKVETADHWRPVTAELTKALTDGGMTTRDDLLVQVVEGEKALKLPIAWHVPATSDVVLNAEKIEGMKSLITSGLGRGLPDLVRRHVSSALWRSWGEPLSETHDTVEASLVRIRGVLAHEAAHSMWSHYIMDEWFKTQPARIRAVITQLDEVRIEHNQIDRDPQFRTAIRTSSTMLLPGKKDMEDLRSAEGGIDLFSLALSSVLVLGRADQGILLDYQVREYRWLVEDLLGWERVQDMRAIWNDFAEIDRGKESDHMVTLAEEWLELFKLDREGSAPGFSFVFSMGGGGGGEGEGDSSGGSAPSGDGEESGGTGSEDGEDGEEDLDLPGLLDVMAEILGEMAEEGEAWAANEDNHGNPTMPMDSDLEAEKVFGAKRPSPEDAIHSRGGYGYRGQPTFRDPTAKEQQSAKKFAEELDKLSLRARSVTRIKSQLPPGRLKTRGAVAQAADRAQGRASQQTPWQRTIRKHNDSPPLCVGIITDVSGSMGWAENFVASTAWVISRAVRHINGKAAAAVFGVKAEAIIAPTDKLDKVIVRPAVDGSEAFNSACAAVDGMLRLQDPRNGARILFVVSDGMLVADGEMAAAAKWVEILTRSGCAVIWITDRPGGSYGAFPAIPKGARAIKVNSSERSSLEMGGQLTSKIMSEITRAFNSR